jgi:hypothetical protein
MALGRYNGLDEDGRHEKFGYDGYGRVAIGDRRVVTARIQIITHTFLELS